MSKLNETLGARGLLNPVSLVNESADRLRALQPESRAAFAVLCAQQLMDAHLRLPASQQQSFTLSWASVLQEIWTALSGASDASAKAMVEERLKDFYRSPFNAFSEDGPHDADEDAAAASIYAAKTFCDDDIESAQWSASRLIDATYEAVLSERVGLPPNIVAEFAHPWQQEAAHGILRALNLLEREPWSPDLIPKLRASFNSCPDISW